jgi:spoIIIJ-associated protein
MEWVEVSGSTVEVAVQAALEELGLNSAEEATVEVLQEAKAGFLGMGGQSAIVKVVKAPPKRRRRGSGRGSGGGHRRKQQQSSGGSSSKSRSASSGKSGGKGAKRPPKQKDGEQRTMNTSSNDQRERPEPAPIEEQAIVATEFLDGLLEAFGLEGETSSRIEDEVLYLDIEGEQTEALVGPKGSTMHSVLELTRTTVQRKTFGAPRMRIDIAGYGARRREALTIYTGKLAEQVLADGGEVMLEPMNAADRKVVHDAAGEIDGVRTHSEGEDPRRAVVISAT